MLFRILILIILHLTILITGCATKKGAGQLTRYHQRCDSAPLHPPKDLKKIPDAVPVIEPRSKYGNPSSYVVFNRRYRVLSSSEGYKDVGLASWYGTKFHGYRTSSGELYDMYKMTAAHRTLPLPTYAQIENLANGKKVIVKINDRGPFHSNRLLDLSYAAAAKLDILRTGTAKIKVTAIPTKVIAKNNQNVMASNKINTIQKNAPVKTLSFNKVNVVQVSKATNNVVTSSPVYRYLQVGAFNKKENAEILRKKILQLSNTKLQVHIQTSSVNGIPIFRVRIGPIDDPVVLNRVKNKIVQAKLPIPMAMP
jgi:rare lipoprotein A